MIKPRTIAITDTTTAVIMWTVQKMMLQHQIIYVLTLPFDKENIVEHMEHTNHGHKSVQ